jgi:steroid delta-isomerase-like uncharacterized protein
MAPEVVIELRQDREEGRSLATTNQRPGAKTAEERMQLVEEHVQAEVDHDLDAIMRTWGESPWFDDVAWEEQSYGRDHIRGHYDELLKSFPDLGIEVKERRQTEDAVILEVIVSGTHTGQWRDLPALGRRMASRVCAIYTFDSDGLIQLERTYYDKAIVLEQLGIFKDPRTTLGKVMALVTPPFTIVRSLTKKLLRR